MRHHSRRRPGAGLRSSLTALAVVVLAVLSSCSAAPPGPPVITWYINPDDGGQVELARRCTEAAGGRYTIATSQLPREATEQRQQLIRRLAANDTSIDIMSLDPVYVPEFAEAGFLAPLPDALAAQVSPGVVPSALAGASWRGRLVTVPFWANTQLLWYRKSMVASMGLDMNQPVTWDQIVDAAQRAGTRVAAQGVRAEALTVWLNALIESGGGSVITGSDPADPRNVTLGLTEPAGLEAARIMRSLSVAGVAGPGFSTQDEDASATLFENGEAAFMTVWPFIWPRATSAVEEGTLDPAVVADYGWTLYPRVYPQTPSAPPLGGINLGVGAFSLRPDLSYEATRCITSPANQAYYFVTNGNPASNAAAYDDAAVRAEFPMAPLVLQSLAQAAPRPQTPYYAEVSESLQRTFHPTDAIVPGPTNVSAAELIRAVLAKEALL